MSTALHCPPLQIWERWWEGCCVGSQRSPTRTVTVTAHSFLGQSHDFWVREILSVWNNNSWNTAKYLTLVHHASRRTTHNGVNFWPMGTECWEINSSSLLFLTRLSIAALVPVVSQKTIGWDWTISCTRQPSSVILLSYITLVFPYFCFLVILSNKFVAHQLCPRLCFLGEPKIRHLSYLGLFSGKTCYFNSTFLITSPNTPCL